MQFISTTWIHLQITEITSYKVQKIKATLFYSTRIYRIMKILFDHELQCSTIKVSSGEMKVSYNIHHDLNTTRDTTRPRNLR